MKNKLINIGKSTLTIFAFFFLYAMIGNSLINLTNNLIAKKYLENFVQLGLSCGLIYFFREELKKDVSNAKSNYKKMLKYTVIFILAMIGTSIINEIIFKYTNVIPQNELSVRTFIRDFPVNAIISAVIMAPFYEEIIVRLNLKKCFKHKWTFIIFTGVLFGSFHMIAATSKIEMLYIIPYSILGISLSYIYSDSNSIFYSMMFHTLNNLIRILLIFIGLGGF